MIEEIFKQKADYFDDVLRFLSTYRVAAYQTDIDVLKWFSDYAIFTVLALYDLWILQCDYEKATKVYQQNYYARQTALLCFEILSDISEHNGEKYSKLFIEIIDNDSINARAKSIRKNLNKIRNDNEKRLKDIRDFTAAHREHDMTKQIDIINEMNNDEIMKFAFHYMKEIEILNKLMNDVVKYIQEDCSLLKKDDFHKKYRM